MANLQYKWLLGFILFSGLAGKPASHHGGPSVPVHPFFASVTEMNHNAKDKTLEISCKLFADDLEKILSKLHNVPLDVYNPKDKKQLEQFIHGYLQQHLKIKLNGKPVVLEYLGHEMEDQSAWIFLQVSQVDPPAKVDIFNDIFYETYDTEINIMHVSVGGKRKSTKLDYPNTQASFEF